MVTSPMSIGQRDHLPEAGDASTGAEDLARAISCFGARLLESPDPITAIQRTVAFCHERLQAPAAAWMVEPGAIALSLIDARGVTANQGRELTGPITLHLAPSGSSSSADVVATRFREVIGTDRVESIEADVAVVVVAGPPDGGRVILDAVRALLPPVLHLAEEVRRAALQRSHLDTALSCVAHELRGPVLASKMSIEGVLERRTPNRDLDVLRRSHAELNELATTIDLLLKWTVAGRMPRRRRIDVVRLVHEAVTSVVLESCQPRVRVEGPGDLFLLAVPAALRASVANLVRNALAYSPSGTDVEVTIEDHDTTACIRITDHGRGVDAADRDAIFEPFIRGALERGHRDSHGLGLFIARRMVQAHGGEITIEPGCEGVTFAIEVPVA